MYILHYLVPLIIFYFFKSKIMLIGLILGNLIDLDHIYLRVIGKVGWFKSACPGGFGSQCSFGTYPLHSWTVVGVLAIIAIGALFLPRKYEIIFWIAIGAILNLLLDWVHKVSGVGI